MHSSIYKCLLRIIIILERIFERLFVNVILSHKLLQFVQYHPILAPSTHPCFMGDNTLFTVYHEFVIYISRRGRFTDSQETRQHIFVDYLITNDVFFIFVLDEPHS